MTLVVDAVWKGIAGEKATVLGNIGAAACGVTFSVGWSYLVYTTWDEERGAYLVSSCSRTKPLMEATEDLEALPPPELDYGPERMRRFAEKTFGVHEEPAHTAPPDSVPVESPGDTEGEPPNLGESDEGS